MVDPTNRDTKAYWLLGSEIAVRRAIRKDLMDIALDITGSGSSSADFPLRAAYDAEPQSYGDKYPAAVVYRMTSEENSGIAEAREQLLARIYVAHLMVVFPSHTLGTFPTESARAAAEITTDEAMSAWLAAIAENTWLHARCTGIGRGTSNSGSMNNLGQPMFLAEPQTVLWANMIELGFIFGS